jgi:hypothetical protein
MDPCPLPHSLALPSRQIAKTACFVWLQATNLRICTPDYYSTDLYKKFVVVAVVPGETGGNSVCFAPQSKKEGLKRVVFPLQPQAFKEEGQANKPQTKSGENSVCPWGNWGKLWGKLPKFSPVSPLGKTGKQVFPQVFPRLGETSFALCNRVPKP